MRRHHAQRLRCRHRQRRRVPGRWHGVSVALRRHPRWRQLGAMRHKRGGRADRRRLQRHQAQRLLRRHSERRRVPQLSDDLRVALRWSLRRCQFGEVHQVHRRGWRLVGLECLFDKRLRHQRHADANLHQPRSRTQRPRMPETRRDEGHERGTSLRRQHPSGWRLVQLEHLFGHRLRRPWHADANLRQPGAGVRRQHLHRPVVAHLHRQQSGGRRLVCLV